MGHVLEVQVVHNSLINAYANSKQPDKARKIFEDVQAAGLRPDKVSSSHSLMCTLLPGYAST